MSVVVGTNFSEESCSAAQSAALIAMRWSAALALVHVADSLGDTLLVVEDDRNLLGPVRRQLEHEAERLRRLGPRVVTHLAAGARHLQLAQAALWWSARLLVIAAPSGGSRRGILPGTAERTAAVSPVPTLVVRGTALEQWLRGDRRLRVLVGVDPSAATSAALEWLIPLRRLGECEVLKVHVASKGAASSPRGVNPLEESQARSSHPYRGARTSGSAAPPGPSGPGEILDPWGASDHGGEVMIRVKDERGGTAAQLLLLAEEEAADLLLVGANARASAARFWVRSVSREVLHRASRTSVLCVPAGSSTAAEPPPLPPSRGSTATSPE